MKISEKKFLQLYNFLLVLVSLFLPFGKLSNIAILLFTAYNLFFFKHLNFSKKGIIMSTMVLIPLILELIFFWNNDSFELGLKSVEKYISLLVFAIFIILQFEKVNIKFILKAYSIGMVIILILLELRFILYFPDLVDKYKNGIDLWEVGYKFTESFKVHAPALNLQLCFVSSVCFYFLMKSILNHRKMIFLYIILFIVSFFHVIVVNTRMAICCLLLSIFFIMYYELKKSLSLKKFLIATIITISSIIFITGIYIYNNPFMIEKFSTFTFKNLDKVGKIDELENPEVEAYNSAVTRLSIWKTTINLANRTPVFGVGSSDANSALFEEYKDTNQIFLSKYNFPVHNQYLNYYLKFGIFGLISILIYFINLFTLGYKQKNSLIIAFAIILTISNLTDDFINRFDGIGFTSFFYSLFIVLYLKMHVYKFELTD